LNFSNLWDWSNPDWSFPQQSFSLSVLARILVSEVQLGKISPLQTPAHKRGVLIGGFFLCDYGSRFEKIARSERLRDR
jgi:hypothetical protein